MTKPIVLVVEDDQSQAAEIARTVEKSGDYTAITANNGIEALLKIKENRRFLGFGENRISCILLDLMMPDMDGLQFLNELRSHERKNLFSRFIPVVVVSAYDDAEKWDKVTDRVKGMAAAYLQKPFDAAQLKTLLDRIIIDDESELLIEQTEKLNHHKQVHDGVRKMLGEQT